MLAELLLGSLPSSGATGFKSTSRRAASTLPRWPYSNRPSGLPATALPCRRACWCSLSSHPDVGEHHRLLRRGGGTGGIAQLDGSLEQRDARHVVAGRFGHIYTVRGVVTRYPKANSGVHGAVAVDAQCGAQAAQASAKIVGPVDQVAQVQSASRVAAVELNAAMAVGIVDTRWLYPLPPISPLTMPYYAALLRRRAMAAAVQATADWWRQPSCLVNWLRMKCKPPRPRILLFRAILIILLFCP
jgi:hypothetical protein